MRRRATIFALLGASAIAGFWITSAVIGADDPRRSGEVTHVVDLPDGGVDIYRAQPDGEIVIEHDQANGEVWFESNEVVGHDGKPIICPNGEPLRIDFDQSMEPPSASEAEAAQGEMPADKRAAFNEYTGEFEAVDAVTEAGTYGEVTVSEGLVYKCNADNEPVLVPLSEVDPQAAEVTHQQMEDLLRNSDELTGIGGDPAAADRSGAVR